MTEEKIGDEPKSANLSLRFSDVDDEWSGDIFCDFLREIDELFRSDIDEDGSKLVEYSFHLPLLPFFLLLLEDRIYLDDALIEDFEVGLKHNHDLWILGCHFDFGDIAVYVDRVASGKDAGNAVYGRLRVLENAVRLGLLGSHRCHLLV